MPGQLCSATAGSLAVRRVPQPSGRLNQLQGQAQRGVDLLQLAAADVTDQLSETLRRYRGGLLDEDLCVPVANGDRGAEDPTPGYGSHPGARVPGWQASSPRTTTSWWPP